MATGCLLVAASLSGCASPTTLSQYDPGATTSPANGDLTPGPVSTTTPTPTSVTTTVPPPTTPATPATADTSAATAPSVPPTSAPDDGARLVTVVTATPSGADAAAAFDAYLGFWRADLVALSRRDPAWPPLLALVSGQQRTDTVALLTTNRDRGYRITGTIVVAPVVQQSSSSTATIGDCVDLSGTQAVDAAGQSVAGSQGSRANAFSVALVRTGDRWTVDDINAATDPACR